MLRPFAVCLLLGAGSLPAAPPRPLTTVMYLVNRPASIESFQKNWRHVSIIAPQSFSMDDQGFVAGEVPPAVLETARAHGIAVMPLVTNRGFKQPLMHSVLDSPAARARAIRYLLYFALRDGAIGFQFDYENIHYTYRDRFTEFFREAAAAFHRHGLLLTAAVVGKTSDTRNGESPGGYDNWSGVYDYPRLARHADFLSIMAYPEHAAFSGPGPTAGLPWVRRIVAFTRTQVPAAKLSLGVPLYGHHWTSPEADPPKWKARSARYPDAIAATGGRAPEWNEQQQGTRVAFTDSEGRHEIWWEDARSLEAKLSLVQSEQLPGISAWVLGHEDPAIWDDLSRRAIAHPRPRPAGGSKAAARALAR